MPTSPLLRLASAFYWKCQIPSRLDTEAHSRLERCRLSPAQTPPPAWFKRPTGSLGFSRASLQGARPGAASVADCAPAGWKEQRLGPGSGRTRSEICLASLHSGKTGNAGDGTPGKNPVGCGGLLPGSSLLYLGPRLPRYCEVPHFDSRDSRPRVMVRPTSTTESSLAEQSRHHRQCPHQPTAAFFEARCPSEPRGANGSLQAAVEISRSSQQNPPVHLAMDSILSAAQEDSSSRWNGANTEYPPLRSVGFC